MAYWLIKSEPNVWSWDQQVKVGDVGEPWTGVRNYQARNNMRAMKLGDKAFFYHSNIGKEIVGICEVCVEIFPDPTNEKWECVKFRALEPLKRPYSLEEAKLNPNLADMALVKLTRLSVQPVKDNEWHEILKLVGQE